MMLRQTTIALFCVMAVAATPALADRGNSGVTMRLVNSSDDVGFNIAADASGSVTPNVLSDLRWEDMDIWQMVVEGEFGVGDHFKIAADIGVGVIVDGQATDSDYLGDNRTDEWSRATATVDGKRQLNGSVSFGWEMRKQFEKPLWQIGESEKQVAFASDIRFTPILGYGYAEQEIQFKDGIQEIPDLGPFPGLNSSFDPKWYGTFVGFRGQFRVTSRVYVNANLRFWPWMSYEAEATWNLRTDLSQPVSFKQDADADGTDYEIGLEWYISDDKSIGVSYREIDFSTDPGTDHVITAQGENLFTRLNRADWSSEAWTLSYQWRFGD
jgi:hypothetical protein